MAIIHAAAFPFERPWQADEFANLLDHPLTFALGDTRAFALIRVVVDEAELLTIATHPDHQRQGLAQGLMQHWHRQATQRGATHAFLEVAADNNAAINLYSQYGYRQRAKRPAYYPRPSGAVDALIMQAALT